MKMLESCRCDTVKVIKGVAAIYCLGQSTGFHHSDLFGEIAEQEIALYRTGCERCPSLAS